MWVGEIDERFLRSEHDEGNFVVFMYAGDEALRTSWAVSSHLVTNASLPEVLRWLREHLPADRCWSLGVVTSPAYPRPDTHLEVAWVVGADVLNTSPEDRSPEEQRLAEEMLARRGRVTLDEE